MYARSRSAGGLLLLGGIAIAGAVFWFSGRRLDQFRRRLDETTALLAGTRAREERFRFLYEDNPTMYFTLSSDWTILSANRFGANYLGYAVDELVGRHLFVIVHESDRGSTGEHLQACIRAPGEIRRWEFRKVRKQGGILWVREDARAVRQADGSLAILLVCTDITELKRIEGERERRRQSEREARAADAARGDAERQRDELQRVMLSRERLIRGFSHDVKNPLGAADGHLQMLEDGLFGTLVSRQVQSVRQTRRSIRGALDLIQVLVDVARVEAGGLVLEQRPVDLRELASSTIGEYRAQAKTAGLDLHVRIPDVLPILHSDPGRIRQILSNLISNALKYTDHGEVNIRAEQREDTDAPGAGHWIAIEVSDTGRGITLEQQQTLFQEYRRLEPQASGGAGLGLAISRRLAHLLGGDLTVKSQPGVGSTFTLWLPPESAERSDANALPGAP